MHEAACVAVGSELLGEHRLDRNSLRIATVLGRHGIRVAEKRVVGDDLGQVARTIRELMSGYDLVVVTGGLGPTADDVTRQAVAEALQRELSHSAEAEEWILTSYRRAGRVMPAICRRMAATVAGARLLRNDRGSAPGLLVEDGDRVLAVFPGVPWEMEAMLERDLAPLLAARASGWCRLSRTLLLGGVIESETESRIAHLYERFGRDNVTILAAYGVLRLVLSAEGEPGMATAQLDEMDAAFSKILGADVAGRELDGLAAAVLEAAGAAGTTIATAESCTGGLVGSWLTAIPGSSECYRGGVISYSNEAKNELLGVPEALLIAHGAVSEAVARAMADGARDALHAEWGLAITGVAGPGGGSDEKPVGLVHWAVAGPTGTWADHRVFTGNRGVVREWSANAALDLLRRRILDHSVGTGAGS